MATAEDLLQGALHLDVAERTSLARAIVASLDASDPDIAAAWNEEIRRRAHAVDDGTEPLVDGPGSLRAIRERLGLREAVSERQVSRS